MNLGRASALRVLELAAGISLILKPSQVSVFLREVDPSLVSVVQKVLNKNVPAGEQKVLNKNVPAGDMEFILGGIGDGDTFRHTIRPNPGFPRGTG